MELGGENSIRLVLGGCLGDLTAEHYTWVGGVDKRFPDTTTAHTRAECFLARIRTLFTDGLILTMPDTFTGATLKFLEKTSYYSMGNGAVQAIAIGDWENDPHARRLIQTALNRVRVVVANIEEDMKVDRPKHSWMHAFAAFRLPSPLSTAVSVSDVAGRTASAEVKASLTRICEAAELPVQPACTELLRLLPRAEKFRREGCCPRAAWGRPSAEFPELKHGRALAECFLNWKTVTGNIERRFRRFAKFVVHSGETCWRYLCQIACL